MLYKAFVRIFCLVGLPMFALAALFIWRPVGETIRSDTSLASRIAWTTAALIASALLCVPVIFLPIMLFVIWRPPRRTPIETADRIAWTIFAFGISLMLTMFLYAAVQEGDGGFRTWETIRLHSRLFVAISMIPIAGPLIVYLVQSVRDRRSRPLAKKAPVDDWDAEPPFGTGV